MPLLKNPQNKDLKHTSSAHAKYRLRYHLIFSTKYRKKCLAPIRDQLFSAFKFAESQSSVEILIMEIDQDHIHLLLKFPPTLSLDQVVRRFKQLTTWHLWENCENHLRKYYWGNKKRLWTGGYFASTIGDVSEENITRYIQNQG